MRFGKGPLIASDPKLDWGADYVHMLGLGDPNGEFAKLHAAVPGAALRPRERQRVGA